jgi:hypothetical protein
MHRLLSLGVVIVTGLTAAATRAAAPAATGRASAPSSVPESLRPWIPWVMHDHEQDLCPSLNGDDADRICAWAGRLELSLAAGGGRFSQTWELFAEGPIPLPGGGAQWPLDVEVDGRAAVATSGSDDDDAPQVRAPAGRHTVTGTFVWKRLPETLRVPARAALLSLTLSGRAVEFPSRSEAGTLFLRKDDEAAEAGEEDRLDITVHRRVSDEIPLQLTTRIALNVAGKAREVVLGKSLPAGFVPQALESALPVRFETDGRLRVQLRPGQWVVTLTARSNTPTARISRPRPDGPWKEGEEVWVFQSRPPLRVVTVEGVPGVDPQQTTLPNEWKALPAYVMAVDATMALIERRRGDADPAADSLSLQRSFWLDFDGQGLTARDEITASFRRAWRLSMGPESRLGRAAVGGQDQFITRLDGTGGDGIEIRQASATIVAESRVARAGGGIPAVGWDHDFQSVGAQLALPPGWRLFHASGADTVSTSWLRNWTLLDLFLVLITGIGIGKLYGPRAGALALATLALVFPELGAPKWVWLVVLVGEALARALPAGAIRRVAALFRLTAWVALVLVAIPFAIQHVRVGLHPALAADQRGGDDFELATALMPARRARFAAEGSEAPLEAPPPPPPAAPEPVGTNRVEADTIGGNVDKAEGKEEQKALEAKPKPRFKRDRGGPKVAAIDGLLSSKDSALALLDSRDTAVTKGYVTTTSQATQNLTSYDPNVLVQTGPGVPRWTGSVVRFGWNGPVERTQRLALWLLPPWLNMAFAFLRVGLVALLIWLLLGGRRGFVDKWRLGAAGPAMLLLVGSLALLLPATARADTAPAGTGAFPPDELLEKLHERLVERPKCEPNCASIGRLAVEASPDRLRLKFDVGAEAATVAALPGQAEHWLPAQVLLDGKPAGTMVRDEDGAMFIRLTAGGHQIVMEGPLPARDVVQIPFPLTPHALTTAVRGWRVEGLDEDGQVSESLQLVRVESAPKHGGDKGNPGGLAPTSLPPFVTVERTLELGLKWVARTSVTRQSPTGAAIVLEVPLLPGESVISEGVRVVKGKVQVNLGAEESVLAWASTLTQAQALTLEAPAAGGAAAWAETWMVIPGPLWHVTFSGIPPVQPAAEGGARAPTFRPWPGEKVSLAITRPAGTGGQTLTIDDAQLHLEPGIRSTAATLTVRLRSSRGGEHAFTLPEGATLERIKINGVLQPLRQDGRAVTVPVAPGASAIELAWREPGGLALRFRAPEVDLRVASVNATVKIDLPADRWVLSVGGPRLGPAVLFWSVLIVMVLAGIALARSPWTPLGARHWILLGIGLVQTSVAAAAVVAGLFLAFGWRRSRPMERAWRYDLSQLALALWTVAAITVLASGVGHGLLGYPEMMIAGNGSSSSASGTSLAWFADRMAGPLPRPWVVSVPLLAYRLAMLAWSLWLALAVIRWARWIWACFSEHGLWHPLTSHKKTTPAPPPAGPAPPASPPSG